MADRALGILLDTSAVVAHLRGRIELFSLTLPSEALFLPLTALGELYKGAGRSKQPEFNRRQVNDFLEFATVLYPDQATAEIYAEISCSLQAKGQIIPENDIWIASVAIGSDMPLATLDYHFGRVDGLTVIYC